MTDLDDFGPVVLGGNVFGWTADKEQSFAVLDAFVDGGGSSIDTADVYSRWGEGHVGGESETVIGEWLASRGRRDDVQLHTKVAKLDSRPGLSAANIAAAVDDSLRRLQTDHLDLYYAHEDDDQTPQEEYVAAFDLLVRDGKVRAVGASNFTAARLGSALDLAAKEGLTPFTVAQDQWNLVERDLEQSLVPTLRERGLVELPYFALASGFLTGKYRPGVDVDSARAGGASRYLAKAGVDDLLTALDETAEAHSTSVTAVALAWLRAQDPVGAPIASARTVDHVAPLLDAVSLTDAELARLTEASARLG